MQVRSAGSPRDGALRGGRRRAHRLPHEAAHAGGYHAPALHRTGAAPAGGQSGTPAQDTFDALPWRLRPRGETAAISGPRSGSVGRGGGTLCRGGNCGQLREASARSEVGLGRVAAQDVRSRRLQDANPKNPIRFSLHRRVFRLSRRTSAARVASQLGAPCSDRQRPSSERNGQACLESEVEGASGPGRRAAAEQGRPTPAGVSPQRLVGTTDRPRGLAVQPAGKGRGGRPGGKP